MSINDPRIDALRERFNALQLRKSRAYANRTGSFYGCSRLAGDGLRFAIFCQNIERAERVRVRFARHVAAVEATPVTQYVRFLFKVGVLTPICKSDQFLVGAEVGL